MTVRYRLTDDTPSKPLDEPVFLALAATNPTPDAIASFAVDHGLRGPDAGVHDDPRGWVDTVTELHRLVALWELILGADPQKVAPYFPVQAGTPMFISHPVDSPGLGRDPTGETLRGEAFALAPRKAGPNPVGLARAYLRDRIDRGLRTHAINLRATYPPDGGGPVILAPTVPALVWLEFARAVDAGRGYARCAECGRWAEVGDKGGRSARRYCSPACRVRAYRRRQTEARRLHHQGRTFEEIAVELNVTPAAVRRWVTGGSEPE